MWAHKTYKCICKLDYPISFSDMHTTQKRYANTKRYDNTLDNFGFYVNKKSILEVQDIKGDYRNLMGKSSDTESHKKHNLSRHMP